MTGEHVGSNFQENRRNGRDFLSTARNVNHDEEVTCLQQFLHSIELQEPLDCDHVAQKVLESRCDIETIQGIQGSVLEEDGVEKRHIVLRRKHFRSDRKRSR
jgi:hypothetical protein